MPQCQHCSRKTALPLCTPCTQNLANLLKELPWLLHQLDVTLCRQDHLHPGNTHTSHTTNPINIGAMETMRQTSTTLHQIALDVATIHASERIPALVNASPAQVAIWLKNNLNAIQKHERAGEHYKALTEIIGDTKPGQIHHIINRPDHIFAGPCPTTRTHNHNGEPIRCNHILWAHDGEQTVTCPRCGHTIDVQHNVRRAAQEADLLPIELIIEIMNNLGETIRPSTIHNWIRDAKLKHQGFFTRKGHNKRRTRPSDPPVYSLTQARQLRANQTQTTTV